MPISQWTRLLATKGGYQPGRGVSVGTDGYIYVTGYTTGSLDGQTNSGINDAFISKFSPTGTKVWTKLLGSANDDFATSVSVAVDGSVYVAGYTFGSFGGQSNGGTSDAFLTKYDANGNAVWTKFLGNSNFEDTLAVQTDRDGAVYVTGYTSGTLDGQVYAGGNADAYLTKYLADGTKAWTKLLGTAQTDQATTLSVGADGMVFVGGLTYSALDGQVYNGGQDAFLVKFTADGTKVWTREIGSSGADRIHATATGPDGSIYACGYTTGALDGQANPGNYTSFLVKYGADGSKLWTKLLGNTRYNAKAISIGPNGTIYLSGMTNGWIDGQSDTSANDAFLIQYASDGTKLSTSTFGTSLNDVANSIATAPDGSIYVGGYTQSALNGQSYIGGAGDGAAFLVKFQPDATSTYALTAGSSVVNEGVTAAFTLTTTNVASGTSVSYTLSGAGITSGDIVGGLLTGIAPIDVTGKAIISVVTASDSVLEGKEYLRLSVGDASAIVSISDATALAKTGFYTPPGKSGTFAVAGNYAYLLEGGSKTLFQIVDISNKAAPKLVSTYSPTATGGGVPRVAVSGNFAYLATDWGGLEIVDITNPSSPKFASVFRTAGNTYDVAIKGNYAYIADWSDGLRIVDISNPLAPKEVGYVVTSGNANGVQIQGNYAYVADYYAGFKIIDISNPLKPLIVASVPLGLSIYDTAVNGNYVYVPYSGGLNIYDASIPSAPQLLGTFSASNFYTVAVAGNLVYAISGNRLYAIDVSTPSTPSLLTVYDFSGYPIDVQVLGDYVYATDNAGGLIIFGGAVGPTYALSASNASVNEGSTATFTLTTTGVIAGTSVPYTLSGSGITSGDIASGQLSGSVTIDSAGKATMSVPIAADQVTEGAETLTVTAKTASASILINDTSPPVTYVLSAGGLSVNEGSTATFTLTTTGVIAGTSVPYTLSGSGITSGDIASGQLSGSVTIDSAGKGTIYIPISSDGVTEGAETLLLTLGIVGGKSASIVINDAGKLILGTPIGESISGSFGSDTIDGGSGVDTVFYNANQSAYSLTNGAAWTVSSFAEGVDILSNVERLHFADLSLALDLGVNQASGKAAMLLGAVLPGKLALDPSKHSLMGTVVGLFDMGYSLTDLAGALLRLDIWTLLTGSNSKLSIATYLLSNVNGVAPDAVTQANAVNALTTEPVQGAWLAALAGSLAGQSHIGLATLAQSGMAYIAPESITSNATNVNEGSTVSFNAVTNLPSGTSLPYTLSGAGITAGDIVGGALSGTVTVGAYGRVSVPVGIVADSLTEGPETLTFTSRGLSASVLINDTSPPPVPVIVLTGPSASVDEGKFATFTLTTANVAPGTVYQYTLSGTSISTSDIGGGQLSGYIAISQTGTTAISILMAADSTTEGPETLVLSVAGKTSSVVINDTSLTPAPTYILTAVGSSVNEGSTATFTLTTTNVTSGTVYPYTLSGTGITGGDIVGGQLSGAISINAAGATTISIPIAADLTTEVLERLYISGQGATAYIDINDISKTPPTYTILPLNPIDNNTIFPITLRTSNVSPGTLVRYSASILDFVTLVPENQQQDKILRGQLFGDFLIDNNGYATVNFENLSHPDPEILRITLTLVGLSQDFTLKPFKGG